MTVNSHYANKRITDNIYLMTMPGGRHIYHNRNYRLENLHLQLSTSQAQIGYSNLLNFDLSLHQIHNKYFHESFFTYLCALDSIVFAFNFRIGNSQPEAHFLL